MTSISKLKKFVLGAAFLACTCLTGCVSPQERMEAMRDQCESYNRPRGIDGYSAICQQIDDTGTPSATTKTK